MRKRGFEIISAYSQAGIILPARKTRASAGYDIAAAEDAVIEPGAVALIATGLKAYMPENEYLAVHIRSGLSVKSRLSLINGQGIIDSDYYNNADNEGHILIAIYNHGQDSVAIAKGSRIAQGIFQPYGITDQDDQPPALRRGGFGSTGSGE
ncbi:MAG: dUTP diphosphatase [Sporomusaceae bacterium]|nr:dUTP diphosphatase [Sporomusaceae bacterium]